MNVTPGLSRRLIFMIAKDFIFRHDGVFYKPVKVEMEDGQYPDCDTCCDFEPYCDVAFDQFCTCNVDEGTVFKKLELPETSGYDRLIDLCQRLIDVTQDLKTVTMANGKVK
jgi:hypothetical protein